MQQRGRQLLRALVQPLDLVEQRRRIGPVQCAAQQRELVAFHAAHDIVTEAWSPLASGKQVLDDPVVTAIAAKHGVSPAQAVIRWHLQLGCVVIPKSVTPSRIRDNIDVFGFELDAEDVAGLAGLDRGMRTGPNPDEFTLHAVQ